MLTTLTCDVKVIRNNICENKKVLNYTYTHFSLSTPYSPKEFSLHQLGSWAFCDAKTAHYIEKDTTAERESACI